MRPAVIFAAVVFAAVCAWAGTEYESGPPGPPSTLEGPLTVNGPVSMTSGPMNIDGGFYAQSVGGDGGTFGALGAGLSTLGPTVNITGPMTVTGSSSFSEPPTGLTRKGTLVRGASLGLAIGCQDLGTVAVAGVTTDSACNVTRRPAAILNLGITLDCYVGTAGVATVRACALLALLSAPSGNYGVTLVGE